MTWNDFDTILMLSIGEQSKISFFNSKRKDYRCNKREFVAGLKDSFERLGEVINGPHCYHINEGLLYEPFLPKENINKSIDFQISFDLNIEGKSITIYFDQEQMPYLKKSLEDYFQFIKDKESKINHDDPLATKDKSQKNSKLFLSLINKYFEGINLSEFSIIIELHKCVKKGRWKGRKAEAVRFLKHYEMTYEEMNNCFEFEKGKKLASGNENGISLRPSVGINKFLKQNTSE